MIEYYNFFSDWFLPWILYYFLFINFIFTILLFVGSINVFKREKELNVEDFTTILHSSSLPVITFVVPAYNEEQSIISTLDSLLHLSYRYKQIIVANDGSTDKTLEVMKDKLKLIPIPRSYKELIPTKFVRGVYESVLHPEIIVIDKENGERFDALNAGINACNSPYFVTVDADTYIDDAAFNAMIRPLMTSPETVGVGASIRIANGCYLDYNRMQTKNFPFNYLTAMQSIEYLRSFLMKQGWNNIGGNYLLSGAFSMFATEVVRKCNGFAPDNWGEDLEITLRLKRIMMATDTPFKITYFPDPVAWTEGPTTLRTLGKQRIHWHKGALDAIWFHKVVTFNPKYGLFGLFVFPFYIFAEVLEPLVEIFGYLFIIAGLWLNLLDPFFVALFFILTWGFTFIYTVFCMFIEELSFRKYSSFRSFLLLIYYSFIECLGYRQLTLYWRFVGFLKFIQTFNKVRKNANKLNESVKKIIKKGKLQW